MIARGRSRGVVLGGTGGVWRVRAETGGVVECALRGRLKSGGHAKLAVGDDVEVVLSPGGAWTIDSVAPRRSTLSRREPGARAAERVVVANVDQVVVVFAAAKPEPHTRMLDRFLVISEANELSARIVVNKGDLVDTAEALERFGAYPRAGYPLHLTSVKSHQGLDSVREALAGKRSVFTGPSGVGKSSLLNALFPGSNLRVGEISESVNKGRHTTVGALMLPLPSDDSGYVIDTPGLREVGVWGLHHHDLAWCFPEFRPFQGHCRFADCQHAGEPNCAVRQALADGLIDPDRFDSYARLRQELEAGRSGPR